jgi:hypothetical protein
MRIAWHAAEFRFAPATATPCAQRLTSSRPSNAAIMSTAATLRYDVVIMLACMPVKLCIPDLVPIVFKVLCYTAEGSFCTAHTGSEPLGGCCTCHVLGIRGANHFSQQGSLLPSRKAGYIRPSASQSFVLSYKPPTRARAAAIQKLQIRCHMAACMPHCKCTGCGSSSTFIWRQALPRTTSMPRRRSISAARSRCPPSLPRRRSHRHGDAGPGAVELGIHRCHFRRWRWARRHHLESRVEVPRRHVRRCQVLLQVKHPTPHRSDFQKGYDQVSRRRTQGGCVASSSRLESIR